MFDLQRFGEEGGEVTEVTEVAEVKDVAEPAQDVKKLIDDAVAKAQSKWETEFKKKDALSKLSDDERRKAELENTRKELENQRAEFERERVKFEATKVLAQRGLPVEFVDYLVDSDNEKTLSRITTFEKKFKKAIEDGVNEKLKGKAPVSSGKVVESTSSVKADFMKAIYDNQIHR